MVDCRFKEGDRVVRQEGKTLQGVVTEIRAELKSPSQKEGKESELMVKVLWDNGIESYFGPDALKKL